MIRIEDRIIKWMLIAFIFFICLITFLLTLHLIDDLLSFTLGKVSENWDVLSLVSSIIVGSITYYGIRVSINYPYNREFVNTYPRKRKLADDILNSSLQTWRLAKRFFDDKDFYKMHVSIIDWIRCKDDLFEKASQVNDEVYYSTKEIFRILSDFDYLLNFGSPESEGNKHRFEKYLEDLHIANINLISSIEKIEKEYEKLKRRVR